MKTRSRRILDLLIESEGFVPVAEVAGAIGAGVRTVFRDIQELEFQLRDYGLVIEKRRSVGIRLLGDVSSLRESVREGRQDGPRRLTGLGSRQRQLATLAYLGHANRVVKLGEVATLFFVSDSCVSGDLKELDSYLAERFSRVILDRQRGIGLTLSGPEWDVRMTLLHAFSELVHPQELIQLILFGVPNNRLERMIETLGYSADRERLLAGITDAESRLGYRICWNDFGLLFLYLVITTRRVALEPDAAKPLYAGTVQLAGRDELFDIPAAVPVSVAERLWSTVAPGASVGRNSVPIARPGRGDAGLTDLEASRLALFLSALDPGEIRESNRCHPDIDRAVSALLAGLEREKSPLYTFDSRLFHTLRVGLSGLVYKKLLGLPLMTPAGLVADTEAALVNQLHGILSPILAALFGVETKPEELGFVSLTVRAAEEGMAGRRRRLRVLVTCFEGIFLAQFISALIRAHFPELTVVSAFSCDRANDAWIVANAIDLVITTFPSGLSAAPEYVLPVPFDADSFRSEITGVLERIAGTGPGRAAADATSEGRESADSAGASESERDRSRGAGVDGDAETAGGVGLTEGSKNPVGAGNAATGGITGGVAGSRASGRTGTGQSTVSPGTVASRDDPEADHAIDAAMQILGNFTFVFAASAGSEADRTALIAKAVCGKDHKAAELLRADLDRREALGPVILEESGIRLYHCRSVAVREARFGVIGTACYLVAPDRASGETLAALSRISVALIEAPEFASAIAQGDENAIKRQLFAILAGGL